MNESLKLLRGNLDETTKEAGETIPHRNNLKGRKIFQSITRSKINRIYDGVEAETRNSQANFHIFKSHPRLCRG